MRVQHPGIGKGLRWMGGGLGGMGVLGTRDVMVGGSRLHGGPARLGEVRPGGNTAVGYSGQRAATALPGRPGMGWFLMFVPL